MKTDDNYFFIIPTMFHVIVLASCASPPPSSLHFSGYRWCLVRWLIHPLRGVLLLSLASLANQAKPTHPICQWSCLSCYCVQNIFFKKIIFLYYFNILILKNILKHNFYNICKQTCTKQLKSLCKIKYSCLLIQLFS
jgi:hypothetical protein